MKKKKKLINARALSERFFNKSLPSWQEKAVVKLFIPFLEVGARVLNLQLDDDNDDSAC